jgi:peptidoglycan hydrolase-like protein with peptidoglycan-binding domain
VRGYFLAWYDSYSASGCPIATDLRYTQGARKTTLRKGKKCAGIVLLQRYLITQGQLLKAPDGYFGDNTFNALTAWQQANNLAVDGKFGPQSNAVAKLFNW